MRKVSWLLILLVVLSLLPMNGLAEVKRYEASFIDVFDTYSQVVVYTDDKDFAQSVAQLVHDELKSYHQLYDIYNEYDGLTNLKTVNDSAGVAPVKVDQKLIDLMVFAKEMYMLTGGRMNVAMGSVLSIWHDYRTEGIDDPEHARLPEMDALKAASAHTDIEGLVIDEAASTLYLTDPEMRLDVGAVAKGYAVERVAQTLIEKGVTSALLSIGGNVRSIGVRADGTVWRVSIQNPDLTAENQDLTKLSLEDLSLVSSGSYQRYYTVDGKQYHHIIDPDTLMPAEYFWAVSIITQDSGLADALSTALYTLPLEKGKALIDSLDGVEALWVTHDGEILRSDGFIAMAHEDVQ
ncbi:MAG: FAD:protein FMN transferase [Eubacteriales bacterium]|nr:FAD:protein FMN transferase [Eubacteriales bacterium]